MADYYIEFIAAGLMEIQHYLSSPGFIDYKTGTNIGDTDAIWNWDDFYYYMAWSSKDTTI